MEQRIPRRVVVRGAAWSVPAVVAAAAAPALATSGCPSFTATGSQPSNSLQRITLTNVGPAGDVILAAGTTITWSILNTSGATRTYTISNLSGLTVSPATLTAAAGATVTFTFTLTADWLPGTTVAWSLGVGSSDKHPWTYQSTIAVKTNTCPPGRSVCVSSTDNVFGTTCPP